MDRTTVQLYSPIKECVPAPSSVQRDDDHDEDEEGGRGAEEEMMAAGDKGRVWPAGGRTQWSRARWTNSEFQLELPSHPCTCVFVRARARAYRQPGLRLDRNGCLPVITVRQVLQAGRWRGCVCERRRGRVGWFSCKTE